MSWADSHCHLPADPTEAAAAVAEAHAVGVTRLVTIGTDAEQTRAAIANARAHDAVWATAGLHPHDAVQGVDGLRRAARRARGGRGGRVRARLPLRPLAPRRAARGLRRAGRAGPRARLWRS